MSRLRYVVLAVIACAAAAVVVVALRDRGDHASPAGSLAKGKLLAASVDAVPQSFLFGDQVHITIGAVVDRRKLDPNRVHLRANFSPYAAVTPMVRTREDVGPYTKLRWTVNLHCVTAQCVPQIGSAIRTQFRVSTITYAGRVSGASRPSATIAWPTLIAWSRQDSLDPERKALVQRPESKFKRAITAFAPPWHVDTDLAAVSYRFSPSTVFWVAVALALTLVLAAGLLLHPLLPRFGRHRRREQTPLERALEAVERARGEEEERKALELLAVELRETGDEGLAWTASELAWSSTVPEQERRDELTDTVRRELTGRTNGHRT